MNHTKSKGTSVNTRMRHTGGVEVKGDEEAAGGAGEVHWQHGVGVRGVPVGLRQDDVEDLVGRVGWEGKGGMGGPSTPFPEWVASVGQILNLANFQCEFSWIILSILKCPKICRHPEPENRQKKS